MMTAKPEKQTRTGRVIRGKIVTFATNPRKFPAGQSVICHEKGAVCIDSDGRIEWCGPFGGLPEQYRQLSCDDYGDALVVPGFIDAHIHFPQYRMLAAPGKDLLDWLNRFTFPEEARYASEAHARKAAEVFLKRLFAFGTTSALVFSSVHKCAADALFAEAEKHGMALITGKTMMDRNAPENVCDDPETGAVESAELLDKWHGRGRLRYAITPRFAVTSTAAQLQVSGELLRSHPDCLMQTHLSESAREIATVAELFPEATDYTDIYDRFGLLGPTSLFAHGIHLSDRECERLSESGSGVVHCPTSNTFLGSGLLDINHLGEAKRPVSLGLATDVGGGTSYSMLATMGEAYKVAMLNGRRLTGAQAFYMATLGNARRLKIEQETGSLDEGKWADITVLDPDATPVMKARNELSETLEDVLFSLIILGDDRAVRATYVSGQRVHCTRPE